MTEEQLEHPAVLNFVSELRDTFSGDFIDTSLSKGKPFIFKPILNLLNDPEKVKDEKGYTLREDVLECVHEVNFYFSSPCQQKCVHCQDYYKQFLYCSSLSKESVLCLVEYQQLLDRFSTIGLKKINLLGGHLYDSDLFRGFLNLLAQYDFEVDIYIHITHLNEAIIPLLLERNNITLIVLADGEVNNMKIEEAEAFLSRISHTWRFVISSIPEYVRFGDYIDSYGLQGSVIPFYNGNNQEFFIDNVYLSLEDILLNPIGKQQIFTRQVMNENFFGKLTIMPNGDVYANVNVKVLGNLKSNSLNELVYKEMSQKESWFLKRENQPCCDCVYKLLCPSPSNCELAIGKMNLCTILSD